MERKQKINILGSYTEYFSQALNCLTAILWDLLTFPWVHASFWNKSIMAILFRIVLRLLCVVCKLLYYVTIGLSSDLFVFPKPDSSEVTWML